MADEVTGEMIEAGRKAAIDWHDGGQSGAVHRAIYFAMREAAGDAADLQAEIVNLTAEMLRAGSDAETEWRSHQSGPRETAIYLAMRTAA